MASVKDELRKGALSSLKRAKNSLLLDAADVKKKSALSKTALGGALREDFAKTEFDEEVEGKEFEGEASAGEEFERFGDFGEVGDFDEVSETDESGEAEANGEQSESLGVANTDKFEISKDKLVLLLRKKQTAFNKLLAEQTYLPLLIKCSEVPQNGEAFVALESFNTVITKMLSNPDEFDSESIMKVIEIINATLLDPDKAIKGVEWIWAATQGEGEKMSEIYQELVELRNEDEEGLEEYLYEDYDDDEDEDDDYYYYDDDDDDSRR